MPPESKIRLEPAQGSDLDALLRLHADAFSESVELYGSGPPGYEDPEYQEQLLAEYDYYKILAGDELVGGIIVQVSGEGEYFLDTIFVGSEHQNLGFGRTAMRLMEDLYPDANRWMLYTPYRDYRNHHFYESQGYQKVAELLLPDAGTDPDFTL
ncbi:MAG: GNAT family N-acetyltransferase, partial [Anaerolineales bacterium]|nr:GNAT family N-acetyltransferase [Anaerolineales bacterium]